ncbi:MAG: aldo/keto reductase [Clostridiaceae bacterium]|nr:aldo/keto reductase [Clostridiaceae bacterium]
MDRRRLGHSGIEVSRLCYGTLSFCAAQADLSPEQGGDLLLYAQSLGVDFFDTAEIYETYPHIRYVLRHGAARPVVCTKTYAWDRAGAAASVDRARREMDLDVIDLFLLHEQETTLTLHGHREAFAYLLECRDKGILRAVGISTHAVEPVRALTEAVAGRTDGYWAGLDAGPYRYADVLHPLLNVAGIGLLDGSAEDMAKAVREAHDAGIGVFGMKMLGGGNLLPRFDEAVAFALGMDCTDAYAVGMQSRDEIDMNVALFEGRPIPEELLLRTRSRKRRLLVEDWCTGCGACVARCASGGIRIVDGRAQPVPDRCLLCGYCAAVCRDFAIKVV